MKTKQRDMQLKDLQHKLKLAIHTFAKMVNIYIYCINYHKYILYTLLIIHFYHIFGVLEGIVEVVEDDGEKFVEQQQSQP